MDFILPLGLTRQSISQFLRHHSQCFRVFFFSFKHAHITNSINLVLTRFFPFLLQLHSITRDVCTRTTIEVLTCNSFFFMSLVFFLLPCSSFYRSYFLHMPSSNSQSIVSRLLLSFVSQYNYHYSVVMINIDCIHFIKPTYYSKFHFQRGGAGI